MVATRVNWAISSGVSSGRPSTRSRIAWAVNMPTPLIASSAERTDS